MSMVRSQSPVRKSFMPAKPRRRDSTAPAPEVLALQQRIREAVQRQHKLCAAKQVCEAELDRLMKTRRGDTGDSKLAGLCDDKLEEMRGLAADAESAAAEIGRYSGDLLIFQLRSGRP